MFFEVRTDKAIVIATAIVSTWPGAKISCQVSVSFVLPLKARPPSGSIVEGIKSKTRESKKKSMWVGEKNDKKMINRK